MGNQGLDSQQRGSPDQKFQANSLWVNWYDKMMNAEVLRCSNCTHVEMLIVWAQLPGAGRAIPRTWLFQRLLTKGRELGKGRAAPGRSRSMFSGLCRSLLGMVSSFSVHSVLTYPRATCCCSACLQARCSALVCSVELEKQGHTAF